MSGCSLHEAFPDTAKESGKVARKEERKKAQNCKGPALSFLKGSDAEPDPDRQTRPLPPVEKMGEGFSQKEDVIGKANHFSATSFSATSFSATSLPKKSDPAPASSSTSSYFGKSMDDFADFSNQLNDNPGYQLKADFKDSFGKSGLDNASGKEVLPIPSVKDVWKPLTPSGARTSFFEHLPSPGGEVPEGSSFSREEKETLLKKLDTLFARLEDLESKRNEYAHAEVTLFILSGLFLIFGIESVRKI